MKDLGVIIVGLLRSFGRLQCIMTIWDRAIDRLIVEQTICQTINLRQIVRWLHKEICIDRNGYE